MRVVIGSEDTRFVVIKDMLVIKSSNVLDDFNLVGQGFTLARL